MTYVDQFENNFKQNGDKVWACIYTGLILVRRTFISRDFDPQVPGVQ